MVLSKDHSFASERLAYRGLNESDALLVVAWRSDPENYRWFLNPSPITLESHLTWFSRYLSDPTRYDFLMLADGVPIGTCGLSSITEESCEVSYMVGERSARGHGYASEAVRAMCQLAFDELGVARVEARILSGNKASLRTATLAGLSERERVYAIDREP